MDREPKAIRQLRYFEGIGCVGVVVAAIMIVATPLIVMGGCSGGSCDDPWGFLAKHLGISITGLVIFEMIRRGAAASLKQRGK